VAALTVGVIGAPRVAAGLRPLGVTVAGGSQLGVLVDVQAVRRTAKVEALVLSPEAAGWDGVARWAARTGLPQVVADGSSDPAGLLASLTAKPAATKGSVPPPPPPPPRASNLPPPAVP